MLKTVKHGHGKMRTADKTGGKNRDFFFSCGRGCRGSLHKRVQILDRIFPELQVGKLFITHFHRLAKNAVPGIVRKNSCIVDRF